MSGPTPRYSVISSTFNRGDAIRGAWEALGGLPPPRGGLELVVMDDGSRVPLDTLLKPHRQRLSIPLDRQGNVGPAAPRDRGARLARGEFRVFLDDDCQPAPDWLCALDRVFERRPDARLGGRVLKGLTHNAYSAISQMIVDLVCLQFNPTPDAATFFCSNNIAMPARRFHELGGFDHQNFRLAGGEDRDFRSRRRQRGWGLQQVNDAVIRHDHGLSLSKFWKRCFSYGRGAWTVHRLENQRGETSLRRASALHFSLPSRLSPLWRPLPWKCRLAAWPLLGVWPLANLCGFYYQRRLKRREAGSPKTPETICPGR